MGQAGDRAALVRTTQPIQSVLIMAFFLSIGLLIDLKFIWANLGIVLLLLFLVTIFKTAMNTAIFRLTGQSWPQSFLLGVVLAQIGEFSFLLTRNGLANGLIGEGEMRLVVAVTVLSLAVSPLWVVTARRLHDSTSNGISSLGELLRLIYQPETDLIHRLHKLRFRWRYRPSNENQAQPESQPEPQPQHKTGTDA